MKIDRDRLQLRDRDDTGLLRGGDDIALVNQTEAGAAGEWRADRRIVQLDLRRFDRGHIGRDLCGQLRDQRVLGVELLLGCEFCLASVE